MGFFKKDNKEEEVKDAEVVEEKKSVSTKKAKSSKKDELKSESKSDKVVKEIDARFADVLIAPRVTEKSHSLVSSDKYVFKVKKSATKKEIKKAVELTFDVQVGKVNVINVKSKEKRYGKVVRKKSGFRKAIVQLKEGDKIEFFQGA